MSSSTGAQLSLREQIREDLKIHQGRVSTPGFQALAVQRCGARLLERLSTPSPLRPLYRALFILYRLAFVFCRNVYGIELHPETRIGRRLRIAHQHGITVLYGVEIGDDCKLHQGVTLGKGLKGRTAGGKRNSPRLGDRVLVGPGSMVIGGITIGDDVTIGPNAVVMEDIPAGSTVFTPPARALQLSKRDAPPPGEAGPRGAERGDAHTA